MIIFKKNNTKNLPFAYGFTLIELVVSIAIFLVLFIGVTYMMLSIMQNPKAETASLGNIDNARSVSSRFTNEIRSATYGSYPLIEAQNSEIIFYTDYGTIDGAVNRIRYFISDDSLCDDNASAGKFLCKGIIVPVGGNYNLADEFKTPVLTGLSNGDTPLFYYYNGDYDGIIGPLSQPVSIPQVRFIQINLLIENQTTPQDTKIFSLAAGSAIRILKSNLSQ